MSKDTFFKKNTSIKFIVKNVSFYRKKLTVFNYPILYGQTRDLLAIPEISEEDIRHSLIKGVLAIKIKAKDLIIVYSDIDLIQFNSEQKIFLEEAGIDKGLEISGTEIETSTYNTFVSLPEQILPPPFDFNTFVLENSGSHVYVGDGDIVTK